MSPLKSMIAQGVPSAFDMTAMGPHQVKGMPMRTALIIPHSMSVQVGFDLCFPVLRYRFSSQAVADIRDSVRFEMYLGGWAYHWKKWGFIVEYMS